VKKEAPTYSEAADNFGALGHVQPPLGPVNWLEMLRIQYPFIPIMPPPYQVATLVLQANVARDFIVPVGAAMAMLRGNIEYYVSFAGSAQVPDLVNTADNVALEQRPKSFYGPEGYPFYVGGTTSFSVISPFAGCVVTCQFYSVQLLPEY
jgi:hypothetical protein